MKINRGIISYTSTSSSHPSRHVNLPLLAPITGAKRQRSLSTSTCSSDLGQALDEFVSHEMSWAQSQKDDPGPRRLSKVGGLHPAK